MQGKKRKSDFAGRFFLFLCESVIRVKVKRSDPFGSLPFSMYPPMHGGSSFLHSLIFLYCLRGNRSRGLCAVSRLRIGRSRTDRAPCLTTRQTYAHANSDYQ